MFLPIFQKCARRDFAALRDDDEIPVELFPRDFAQDAAAPVQHRHRALQQLHQRRDVVLHRLHVIAARVDDVELVAGLVEAAQKIVGRTYEPLWLYCEVALIYLIFSTVLTFVQRYCEKKLSAYNSRETEAASVK